MDMGNMFLSKVILYPFDHVVSNAQPMEYFRSRGSYVE